MGSLKFLNWYETKHLEIVFPESWFRSGRNSRNSIGIKNPAIAGALRDVGCDYQDVMIAAISAAFSRCRRCTSRFANCLWA